MGFITPAQFRNGLQEAKDYVDEKVSGSSGGSSTSGGGFIKSYIVGNTPFETSWLSDGENGNAITPNENQIYLVMTDGEYMRKAFIWNGEKYVYAAQKANVYYVDSSEQIVNFDGNVGYGTTANVLSFETNKYCSYAEIEVINKTSNQSLGAIAVKEGGTQIARYPQSGYVSAGANIETSILQVSGAKTLTIDFVRGGSLGWYGVSFTIKITEYLHYPVETDEYMAITDTQDGKSGLVPSISKDSTAEALTPKGWDEIDFNITEEEIKQAFLDSGSSPITPDKNVYKVGEEVVIGTFVDESGNRKNVYRKVYTGTINGNVNGSPSIDPDYSDIDKREYLGITGLLRYVDGKGSMPLGYCALKNGDFTYTFQIFVNRSDVTTNGIRLIAKTPYENLYPATYRICTMYTRTDE